MQKPKLIILDIDGVMTDGKKYYNQDGTCVMKAYNDKDFMAIKLFRAMGIDVCFLSGDRNINLNMALSRNIKFYDSDYDKLTALRQIQKEYNVLDNEIIFVGDGYYDWFITKEFMHTFCPVDSPEYIKADATYVFKRKGGEGVVAELFDYLYNKYHFEIPTLYDVSTVDRAEKIYQNKRESKD